MRALPLVLLLSLAAGPVLAQAGKPPTKPAETPTPVSPVTVMPPTEKPKLVATWPENGQTVAPGVLVLKMVFDQQMTPRDFAYDLGSAGGDKLDCLRTPRLLNDAKTFVLLCTALPGKTYAVALNPAAPGGPAFSNLAENRAAPSNLSFTTGTGDPVTNLRDAMKAAGLGGLDVPVDEAPDARKTAP